MVKYVYDAWGNDAVLDANDNDVTDGIGVLNPFRYRGYYYDEETGLYFLQTRYYDPEIGKFISQDSIDYAEPETINGLNLYAYCGNNPVMNIDPTGTWSWNKFWKILGVVAGTALLVVAVVASAGAVGALAGVGAAALGLSTATVSFISTAATIGTYVVAGSIAMFGISDAVEIGTGGYNPIRDDIMGGNQKAYNATKTTFNVLGSLATIAGSVGPKVLQTIAKGGT